MLGEECCKCNCKTIAGFGIGDIEISLGVSWRENLNPGASGPRSQNQQFPHQKS